MLCYLILFKINLNLTFSPKAFVAALYVDKGLRHVEVFCRVCLFPRLEVKTTFDNLTPTFLPTELSHPLVMYTADFCMCVITQRSSLQEGRCVTTQRDYLPTGPSTFALVSLLVILFSNLVPRILDAISKNALIATAT